MEPPGCEQRIAKVSVAELLRCFEHPLSEEQAWAICFQCCRKIEQLAHSLPLRSVFVKGSESVFIHADGTASFQVYHKSGKSIGTCRCQGKFLFLCFFCFAFPPSLFCVCCHEAILLPVLHFRGLWMSDNTDA